MNIDQSDYDDISSTSGSVVAEGRGEKEKEKHGLNMTIINTNVRSICPKINSVIESFEELEATFGIFTETWLSDGPDLTRQLDDLREGEGLGAITKNRPVNNMGFSHGGVAIIYRESLCTMKEISLPNPSDFEVVLSSTRFPGHSRQVVVVACYIPPTYPAVRANACLE